MRFKDYIYEGYEPDTFYGLEHIRNKIKFLKDCISKSYSVRVDELFNSMTRKQSKATPNDVFKIINDKRAFTQYRFIVRRTVFGKEVPYIQSLVRTGLPREKEYFLWIDIKLEKLDYFIKKYKLKEGFKR